MTLILATNNDHKVFELKEKISALGEVDINLVTLADIGFRDEIEETGATLKENAYIKAKTVYDFAGKACIADDTGLEVEALDGEPGVKSARYAGADCDFGKNIAKLLHALADKKNRKARFRTVIAYINDNGDVKYFEGCVEGQIITNPRGDQGFGYDPIFVPDEANGQTFAEMNIDDKNKISHRARAMEKFLSELKDCGSSPQ